MNIFSDSVITTMVMIKAMIMIMIQVLMMIVGLTSAILRIITVCHDYDSSSYSYH